jgi:hypothetical protein
MDAKTLKALRGSIAKWQAIVDGTGEDHGPRNCPLCKLFYFDGDCDGCPVRENTGVGSCVRTPYTDYVDSTEGSADESNAAQAELAFLQSLLPEGES